MRTGSLTATKERVRLLKWWGAVGFGVGGAGGALVYPDTDPLFCFVALGLMGAAGGATLGFFVCSWSKAVLVALIGALAFGLWSSLGADIGSLLSGLAKEPVEPFAILSGVAYLFFWGAVTGTFAGASIGLAFKSQNVAKHLAFSGAMWFGAGSQVLWGVVFGVPWSVVFAVWGLVGGFGLSSAVARQSIRLRLESRARA